MIRTLLVLLSLGVITLVCIGGCRQNDKSGKPAEQQGTPPPAASTIPPPLPPGRTPGQGTR
jgi:hypothetical protein